MPRAALLGTLAGGAPILEDDLGGATLVPGSWAAIGTTLTIGPDGSVSGIPTFAVPQGDAYGIAILGIPFLTRSIVTATLTITGAVTAPVVVAPDPDGSSPTGYAATFVLPGSATAGLAPGWYGYRIRLAVASGDGDTIVDDSLLVLPAS